MEDKQIIALLKGYQAGTLSEEATIAFFQWYSEAGLEEFHRIYAQCDLPADPDIPEDFKLRLEQDIQQYDAIEQRPRIVRLYRWTWAAAILLLIGVGSYFIYQSGQKHTNDIVKDRSVPNDIAPGTTKAVLTLADGRQVTIDTARAGTLAIQGKTAVQHNEGAITYNGNEQGKTSALLFNTLTTGRGEQSPPLVLADGTKVWLNALSSIRFPVAFTGHARNVEITGEVYLEVAKNASMPFHVKVKDMDVEVLGTQFNINSYADEPDIKTTLLEGKVRVSNGQSVLLQPGQQAVLTQDKRIAIHDDINTAQIIAWKNGLFDFNHASLQTVLRQLSRWYDIDVQFEGNVPARTFRGKITRDLSLSQVTQLLQDVDIKFRIEGKTLIVTN